MKTVFKAIAFATLVFSQYGCGKTENTNNSQNAPVSPTVHATATASAAKPPSPNTVATLPVRAAKVYEGPFGLAMGISIQELTDEFKFKSEPDTPNIYEGTPPKPAPGVTQYMVLASKEQGVCKVLGQLVVNPVNDTGSQIKSETDRVAEMIELKYGKYTKKYDFASQEVYRRNPQFFMMALKEDSVTYAYSWENGKGGLTLPNNLSGIMIKAQATRTDRGYVQLTYSFSNEDDCHAEIKKQKSTNF
jgi:hypothetical protein